MPTLSSLILALACHQDEEPEVADPTAVGPSWYQEVRPIVAGACTGCHNGDGVGPGDFREYDDIAAVASVVADYVETATMPPPVADATCNPYLGHERLTLTDDERAVIVDWARNGMPEGDADTAAALPDWSPHLEDADTRLDLPVAHTVEESGNQYYCEVADNPFTAPTFLTGIDVDLDAQQIVHHMCLFVDFGGDAGAGYGATDPRTGFDCSDPIVEDDWMPLHCWAPGMEPVEFPDGVGLPVMPGQQLVIQMHYYKEGPEAVVDQSAYTFRTDTDVTEAAEMWILGPDDFTIPAGDSGYTDSLAQTNDWGTTLLLGAFPHMHWLGTSYRAWIDDPAGNETCVVAGEYSFDHQMTYMFEEPIAWEVGHDLHMSCTWDNSDTNPNQPSDPPRDVTWGEGTDDEMCYLLAYVLP